MEFWLTKHFGDVGERLHAGRSRNDQVAVDLRLLVKDNVLALHGLITGLADALLAFAVQHRRVLWPGYTHQRAAMPSSAGLWAAGHAAGLADAADAIAGIWPRIDRSPLGSAAGYGAPLPLAREAAARALGFAGLDDPVTVTQNGRGQLEAAVLFWCIEAAHHCAKLSSDVILFTADEFGWLVLPDALSTGSSIMPQKRNPDLFELTRARAAALDGDFATLLALRAKLTSGYHRDFQFVKAPLFRGLDRTREMLAMLSAAVPRLGVDAANGRAAVHGGILATDEVMARVRAGVPFRRAYRDVATALEDGRDDARTPGRRDCRKSAQHRRNGESPGDGTACATARRPAVECTRTAPIRRRAGHIDSRSKAMSLERNKRQLKILELVATRPLHTQEELADVLAREGWEVTQSSVSRDITALGLVKVEGIYQRPAAAHLGRSPIQSAPSRRIIAVGRDSRRCDARPPHTARGSAARGQRDRPSGVARGCRHNRRR